MSVLHDYKCAEHGYFESYEAVCPNGCIDDVMVVFLQATGTRSDTTKKNDKNIKQLAIDFGMSNIKSTREGESQTGFYKRNNKTQDVETQSQSIPQPTQREARAGDSAIWGGGYRGLNMKSIISGQAVKSVHGESVGMNPKEVGDLKGPQAASYVADHDNLQLKK